MEIIPIAHIECDLKTKFGVPRQSGLAEELTARIVFEPAYRSRDALRGIEGFTHLWLIWEFSEAVRRGWSPTVRPPRLGGNARMGVFATRSPFRPNPLGLSCVRLLRVAEDGALIVAGADLMDGTPIYDIKPYVPYADCRPEASGGFAAEAPERLAVDFPEELQAKLPAEKRAALAAVLSQDPRPRYQNDPERLYGLDFAGFNVRFRVADGTVFVEDVEKIGECTCSYP